MYIREEDAKRERRITQKDILLQFLIASDAYTMHEIGELISDSAAVGLDILDHAEQIAHLAVVVVTDLGLDGLSASHGGLVAHHGRSPAERGGGDVPGGVHGCGTHAMFAQEVLEESEVSGLLVVHVSHERTQARV